MGNRQITSLCYNLDHRDLNEGTTPATSTIKTAALWAKQELSGDEGDDNEYQNPTINSSNRVVVMASGPHEYRQPEMDASLNSYNCRSMSSETVGRETRTEREPTRRHSKPSEREEIQDEVDDSRSV